MSCWLVWLPLIGHHVNCNKNDLNSILWLCLKVYNWDNVMAISLPVVMILFEMIV